jgi:secreted PhoX family phosphatase
MACIISHYRGLLCINHEYTHEAILHPDGLDEQSGGLPGSVATIAKIRKSQAAHGVSVGKADKFCLICLSQPQPSS